MRSRSRLSMLRWGRPRIPGCEQIIPMAWSKSQRCAYVQSSHSVLQHVFIFIYFSLQRIANHESSVISEA